MLQPEHILSRRTFTMRWLLCALFAVFMAMVTAGNVIINGACRDCSPPDAETVVVGGQVYKGKPGHGTIYINGQDSYPNAVPSQNNNGNTLGPAGADPYVVPEGYSGPVPGGSYVHNKDCNGCDIRG